MLIVSIAIGVGVAFSAKGEQSPENGWAVALIASFFVSEWQKCFVRLLKTVQQNGKT